MLCKLQGPCEAFGCTWPDCSKDMEEAMPQDLTNNTHKAVTSECPSCGAQFSDHALSVANLKIVLMRRVIDAAKAMRDRREVEVVIDPRVLAFDAALAALEQEPPCPKT